MKIKTPGKQQLLESVVFKISLSQRKQNHSSNFKANRMSSIVKETNLSN